MSPRHDYIGIEFGPFKIVQHEISTDAIDVFVCADTRTGLPYLIRLNSRIQGNEIELPLNNAKIETSHAHSAREESNVYSGQLVANGNVVTLNGLTMYGVSPQFHLVPITSWRVSPSEVRIDVLLKQTDSIVMSSVLWELVGMQVMIDGKYTVDTSLSMDEFRSRWSSIAGSESIISSVSTFLHQGSLCAEIKIAITETLRALGRPKLELVDNPVFRLLVANEYRMISVQQVLATLASPHFRRNVGFVELEQLAAILKGLSRTNIISGYDGLSLLSQAAWILSEEPHDKAAAHSLDSDISSFTLFLQEPLSFKAPFPKLIPITD